MPDLSVAWEALKIIATAALTATATVGLERFRHSRARKNDLRTAYAQWLAAHSSLETRVRAVLNLVGDSKHLDTTKTLARAGETLRELSDHLHKDLAAAATQVHAIHLLETDPALLRAIDHSNELAAGIARLAGMTAHHYSERHMDGRAEMIETQRDLRATIDPNNPAALEVVDRMKARFERWDSACGVIAPGAIERIKEDITIWTDSLNLVRSHAARQLAM
jgi:hypothetical protein